MAEALRDTAHIVAASPRRHLEAASIRRSIARWESSTERTTPGDHYQYLLGLVFARTPTGTINISPASDFDTLLTALQLFGAPPHRIQQLTALITHTANTVVSRTAGDSHRGYHDATTFAGATVGDHAVHAAIPRLRHALDCIDLPDDGPTRAIDDVGAEVARLIDHRLQARYGELATNAPTVISELARLMQSPHVDAGRAATLLTLALRAADSAAFKFGYVDLSARIIDLMRSSARSANDPLLTAAVAYVRTETFFATRNLATASRLLIAAADDLPTNFKEPVSSASYGALHMRAAVVAGRAGDSGAAWDHLNEARRAAASAPEGVYLGTAFGPASVRIHELAVAVELRDSPATVERAARWRPPRQLPAERRSHYYIDLARAQLDLDHHEDAYLCLREARQVAPQHTRGHPQVRHVLSSLVRARRFSDDGLLTLAAWAGVR